MAYGHGAKPVIVTKPDGTEQEFPSGSAAARELGLGHMEVSLMANGKKESLKGFKVRFKLLESSPEQTPCPSLDPIPCGTES